jgi:hypothetical protein
MVLMMAVGVQLVWQQQEQGERPQQEVLAAAAAAVQLCVQH